MEVYRGIGKLIEEMGELQTELGKLIPFPQGEHPDGKGDLRQRIENEMADVRAAIFYFTETNRLDFNNERYVRKVALFKKWGLTGINSDPDNDLVRDEKDQPTRGSEAQDDTPARSEESGAGDLRSLIGEPEHPQPD